MALADYAWRTAKKTVQQKLVNIVIATVAGGGSAISRTEFGTKVLVGMAEFLRDSPIILATLQEIVESEGPQAIDVLVEDVLKDRGITGETRDAIIDAVDDIGEALGKKGADALTPEKLDAYIAAAKTRLAADTRRRNAIDATATIINPAAIAAEGVSMTSTPTGGGTGTSAALTDTIKTPGGKKLLDVWSSPIEAAISGDQKGELKDARPRRYRQAKATEKDSDAVGRLFDEAAQTHGITPQAIEHVNNGLIAMVPDVPLAVNVAQEQDNLFDSEKAAQLAETGIMLAQVAVILVLGFIAACVMSVGLQLYLAYSLAPAGYKWVGNGAAWEPILPHLVYAVLAGGALYFVYRGLVGFGTTIVNKAGAPFAWLADHIFGKTGT